MRVFPGGYRKTEFDKKQDKLATKHTLDVAKKHREELKAIEKEAEQREVAAKLAELSAKFEALKQKGQPKKRNRAA